ncbi:MAG TPA: MEDS domain-containing protein [Acidimicrobiales bacterium]|nr:MEDS domain-containing protein [Acidimicrobiales bacterium]
MHRCCFFALDQDFSAVAADFLEDGRQAGEQALQSSEPLTLDAFRGLTEEALADGFSGLRVAVRTGRAPSLAAELAVDRYTAEAPLHVLCGYDTRAVGPDAPADLACVHRGAEVAAEHEPGFTVWSTLNGIGLSGEVDLSNVVRFTAALDGVAATAGGLRGPFVVDAAELEFADARAAAALMAFSDAMGPRHPVEVVHAPRSLVAVAETLGWGDRLRLIPCGEAA